MNSRHTLVVGGTRGTGLVLVKMLAEENQVLSVIGRHPPSYTDRSLPNVHYWVVDLVDFERLPNALTEVIDRNGKLGTLVFFQRFRGAGDDWAGELETSLTATRFVIESLVDKFEETGDRSIVLVSSIAGQLVAEEQPVSYHVAKAGLNQMIRYYAVTLGRHGIRVNGVSPGAVLKEEAVGFYEKNRDLTKMSERITPLGRMSTSGEIASVIAFLASSKASFVTGQNLVVDGGLSLIWQESLARRLNVRESVPTVEADRKGTVS